ncbi:MAG: hypothetical protein ABR499_22645 [Gemmatimonadaceae bacterium]
MNRKITIIGVALSAVLAVSACAGGENNAGDTGTAAGTAGTTTGALGTPTGTDTGLGATGVGATAGFTGAAADSIRRGTKRVP